MGAAHGSGRLDGDAMTFEQTRLKGDAPEIRVKDTGASGVEYRWLYDAGYAYLQFNNNTEASPTWYTIFRATLSGGTTASVEAVASNGHIAQMLGRQASGTVWQIIGNTGGTTTDFYQSDGAGGANLNLMTMVFDAVNGHRILFPSDCDHVRVANSLLAGANSKPHSTLQSAGSHAFTLTAVSSTPFSVTSAHSFLAVDSSGGARTLNLPTAVGITGRKYCIIKVSSDSNAVTIDANGAETINGATTQVISSQYSNVCIVSDGSNWLISSSGGRRTRHLEVPPNPAPGGAAPTQVIDSSVSGWKFAVSDSILAGWEIPHDWSAGADFTLELHAYSTNTTAGRYVQFRASWRSLAEGEQITGGASGANDSGDILLPTTTKQMFSVPLGTISGASIAAGDHLFVEISRIASSGTAPAVADNPIVVHSDINYPSDTCGG